MSHLRTISLFVLTALLFACGDDSSTGPSGPYTLTITNSTELPILSVAISLNSDSDAGDNWLGTDESLMPGETRTFQHLFAHARLTARQHAQRAIAAGMCVECRAQCHLRYFGPSIDVPVHLVLRAAIGCYNFGRITQTAGAHVNVLACEQLARHRQQLGPLNFSQ